MIWKTYLPKLLRSMLDDQIKTENEIKYTKEDIDIIKQEIFSIKNRIGMLNNNNHVLKINDNNYRSH